MAAAAGVRMKHGILTGGLLCGCGSNPLSEYLYVTCAGLREFCRPCTKRYSGRFVLMGRTFGVNWHIASRMIFLQWFSGLAVRGEALSGSPCLPVSVCAKCIASRKQRGSWRDGRGQALVMGQSYGSIDNLKGNLGSSTPRCDLAVRKKHTPCTTDRGPVFVGRKSSQPLPPE